MPRMVNLTGGPTGSTGPAINDVSTASPSIPAQPQSYKCQAPGCDREFLSLRGRGVHQQRMHKNWYDEQQHVDQIHAQWSAEESALLARQEARAVVEGKKFMNQALKPFFPQRTLEAIKGQRRKPEHKSKVLEMVRQLRQPDIAAVLPEDQPRDETPVNVNEKFIRFISELPRLQTTNFEPQLLDVICTSLLLWTPDQILEEITGYLLRIFPIAASRKSNHPQSDVVASKKKQRRIDYSRTQMLWERSPGDCLRKILKDKTTAAVPPKDIMIPFWEEIMTNSANTSPGINIEREIVDILWAPIQIEEIKYAFPERGTAPGPDGMSARVLRSIPGEILIRLLNIFMICRKLPDHLMESRTILIPKKDGAHEPGDFRPITVSSVLTRLFHKVLATRILKYIRLDTRQKAFLPVDGCSENIFLLDLLLKHHRQKFKPTFIASIDIAKAFDSVTHKTLEDTLISMGIPGEMVQYIMYTYHHSYTTLVCGDWRSHRIHPSCGVKQGDPLSPIIFNMVIERLLKKLPPDVGARIGSLKVDAIAFADDMIFAAQTEQGLQLMIDTATDYLTTCGLYINSNKCLTISLRNVAREKKSVVDAKTTFICRGRPLPAMKRTDEWKYLGVPFTPEGRTVGKPVECLSKSIAALSKAPLKPQQKLFGLRVMVIPGLFHQLTLGKTHISTLKKLDKVSRAAVRNWLDLPHDCVNAYFHADVKDGGLSIPSVRWLMPLRRYERLKKLQRTGQEMESPAALFLQKEVVDARQRLNDHGNTLITAKSITRRWATLLHQSCDGTALKESRKVPAQHRWITEGSKFLSGRDFLNMTKMRINALPTRSRTTRGRRADRLCRAGCNDPETLNHIVQKCHRTHDVRVQRHNAVASYIERAFAKDHTTYVEPHFKTSEGLRKPDLLVKMGETAVVVDTQIVSEQADLKRAHKAKIDYYKPLENMIKERYQVQDVIFSSLTLSMRGIWSVDSAESLRNLGAIKTKELKIISTRALVGGLQAFRKFNLRTGTRHRTGIG